MAHQPAQQYSGLHQTINWDIGVYAPSTESSQRKRHVEKTGIRYNHPTRVYLHVTDITCPDVYITSADVQCYLQTQGFSDMEVRPSPDKEMTPRTWSKVVDFKCPQDAQRAMTEHTAWDICGGRVIMTRWKRRGTKEKPRPNARTKMMMPREASVAHWSQTNIAQPIVPPSSYTNHPMQNIRTCGAPPAIQDSPYTTNTFYMHGGPETQTPTFSNAIYQFEDTTRPIMPPVYQQQDEQYILDQIAMIERQLNMVDTTSAYRSQTY